MKTFDYIRAQNVAEAAAAAAVPGTVVLAGGTNLLDVMKGNLVRPDRLVDITHLQGLDRIETLPEGGVRIGALVRNSALAHDQTFAKTYPAVAEARWGLAAAEAGAATMAGSTARDSRQRPCRPGCWPCPATRRTNAREHAAHGCPQPPAHRPLRTRSGRWACWYR